MKLQNKKSIPLTKYILSILVSLICVSGIMAQRTCGYEVLAQKEAAVFPNQSEDNKKAFKSWLKEKELTGRSAAPVTIPVHVIVTHEPGQAEGQGDNLSMERILSQIQVLNDDFARTNSDAINTPSVFDVGSTEISFCLATVDQNGNPTTGVTRYPTNLDFQQNESMIVGETMWPPSRYLNIYLAGDLSGLLGYSPVPNPGQLPPTDDDVVVILTSSFGGEGFATAQNYDLGRTATHEIGHWLGLRHVWGNGGCSSDDGFDDTPTQTDSNFGCPNHPSPSCNNGGDMFMNFMDYVNDNCMNSFSAEQAAYMEMILEGTRTQLTTSANTACAPSGAPIVTVVNQQDIICSGEMNGSIELTATSGTAPYTYSLNGGVAQAGGLFNNLPGGDHIITVTESEGIATEFSFTINEPPPVEFDIEVLSESCIGGSSGSVSIATTGGNLPYKNLTITSGGTSFSKEDYLSESFENGIPSTWVVDGEWASGTANELSSLSFQIPDREHCIVYNDDGLGESNIGMASITTPNIVLNGITEFNVSFDAYYIDGSYGGIQESAILFVSGDDGATWAEVGPLTGANIWVTYEFNITDYISPGFKMRFDYDDGGGWNFGLGIDNVKVGQVSDGTFSDLQAGVYDVIITDRQDCTYNTTFEILASDPITISDVITVNPSCDGIGQVNVVAASANGISSYELNGVSNTTGEFTVSGSGDYTITVIDNAGCTKETLVTLIDQGGINLSLNSSTNVSCNGLSDGSIFINLSGVQGEADITLNGTPTTEKPYENLPAGVYVIEITDEVGCDASLSVTITEPDALILSANVINESCNSPGEINFTTTGGTAPYSYSYNNGPFSETNGFPGLLAGTYDVSCRDANGCTASMTYSIVMDVPLIEVTETVIECGVNSSGIDYMVELCTESGETGDWTIYDNQGSLIIDAGIGSCVQIDMGPFLSTGTDNYFYAVEVNINGCVGEFNTVAVQPSVLNTEALNNLILCAGDFYGYIASNDQDFSAIDIVDMNGASVEIDGNGAYLLYPSNTYTISTIDLRGCTAQSTVTIEEAALPILTIINQTDATNSSLGSIEFGGNGGSGSYSFTVNGETNQTGIFTDLAADSYIAIITDELGCTSQIGFEIKLESAVEDIIAASQIKVYPNPMSSRIAVSLEGGSLIDEIVIYHSDGRLIKEIACGVQEMAIDVEELGSGVYMLGVKAEGRIGYRRLVKVR